jgi:hypothetical protein
VATMTKPMASSNLYVWSVMIANSSSREVRRSGFYEHGEC